MSQEGKDPIKSEAEIVATSLSKGSTFLFFGRFLFYLIGFIGFAIVARLVVKVYGNAEPLGWIYVASTIPGLIGILSDFGVGYGIMNKFIVNFNQGNKELAYKYFWTGSFYSLILNSIYALGIYFLGTYIVINLFNKPEAYFLIPIYSIGLLANWFYGLSWNGAIMIDKIWINGATLILQIFLQYGFSIIFLLLGYGIWGVAFSASIISPLISGILGSFFLFKKIPIKLPSIKIIKESFRFGFPVYSGSLIGSVQSNVFNALISRFSSNLELGYYSVAQRLAPIIDLLTYPLNTLMFPMFSRFSSTENVSLFFKKLIKLNSILTFIAAFLILSMPMNLLTLFFGSSYSNAYMYVIYLSIYWIESGLGGNVITNLLMGQGKTKLVFNLYALGSLFTLILGIILIPFYGIIGSLISAIFGFWPPFILSLKYTKREFDVDYPLQDVLKVIALAVLSALLSFLIINFVSIFYVLKTIFAGIFGFFIYIYLVKKLNIITQYELNILDNSFSNIPYIGNILKELLSIYKKI